MGGKSAFSIPAVVIAGLLAGCGPPLAWQKPGVSLEETQADSRDCASLARDQAFRESFFGYGGPSYYGAWPSRFGPYPSPYGGYGNYYWQDSFMWRAQREGDLQNFCLRARGYHLAPVAQQ